MNDTLHTVLMILTIALVTAAIRFLPFFLFPEGKEAPGIITYLSKVLPCAVVGMLVVYCLKSVSLPAWPHGLPEGMAIALVAGSYAWKRNTLLSILGGTVAYMLLIQFVF